MPGAARRSVSRSGSRPQGRKVAQNHPGAGWKPCPRGCVGPPENGRTEAVMPEEKQPKGMLGVILGALMAISLIVFLLNGGEHFGKTTVEGDKDLPPVLTHGK